MYANCNFVGTRHGTSERGGDYGWEIYDNCIFCVGTMCTSSQYLMEYCDLGMGFYCNGILIIWIFVGTRHGTSVRGGILDGKFMIIVFFV